MSQEPPEGRHVQVFPGGSPGPEGGGLPVPAGDGLPIPGGAPGSQGARLLVPGEGWAATSGGALGSQNAAQMPTPYTAGGLFPDVESVHQAPSSSIFRAKTKAHSHVLLPSSPRNRLVLM